MSKEWQPQIRGKGNNIPASHLKRFSGRVEADNEAQPYMPDHLTRFVDTL